MPVCHAKILHNAQGADQQFAAQPDSEASEKVVEQLCKEVLTFAHHLVELGPMPAAAPLENGALDSQGKPSRDQRLLYFR